MDKVREQMKDRGMEDEWITHALDLNNELATLKEQMRVLEDEMLVLGDERNAAVLDAKENMEIANEFKKLMEQYRQHAEVAYKQSNKLSEALKSVCVLAGMCIENITDDEQEVIDSAAAVLRDYEK